MRERKVRGWLKKRRRASEEFAVFILRAFFRACRRRLANYSVKRLPPKIRGAAFVRPPGEHTLLFALLADYGNWGGILCGQRYENLNNATRGPRSPALRVFPSGHRVLQLFSLFFLFFFSFSLSRCSLKVPSKSRSVKM